MQNQYLTFSVGLVVIGQRLSFYMNNLQIHLCKSSDIVCYCGRNGHATKAASRMMSRKAEPQISSHLPLGRKMNSENNLYFIKKSFFKVSKVIYYHI